MNEYFYKVWIPIQVFTVLGFMLLFTGIISINWYIVLISWFLIGPVGVGVGFHKLFSHRQFVTWKPVEYTLAILGTLSAYAPILFWVSNHQLHHRISDTEKDVSSPIQHGFLESFFTYRMRKSVTRKIHLKNFCSRAIIADKFLMFLSKHFIVLIWTVMLILMLSGYGLLFNLFLLPVLIEHTRTNVVSSLSHMDIPFSYRNYETKDNSQNNIIIGILSMGFGWHNNHHHNPRQKHNRVKWWELDVEGRIAKILSKE